MKPADREKFFARLSAANPDPASELTFGTPYELLVSVILSAQATDLSVNKATAVLFPVANTPAAIVALGVEKLEPFIRTIGLYRTKAKNVVATSRLLIEQHGGEVPRDRAALEALPGVGRKTANVVLNVAFGEHTLAVDTHVFRVSNRTRLAPGKTVEIVEHKLMKVVPPAYLFGAHHWLILHGRYVCKARVPECWRCPVIDVCPYRPKTPPPLEPAPGKKRVHAPIVDAPSARKVARKAAGGARRRATKGQGR
jgi:endonuclease-3